MLRLGVVKKDVVKITIYVNLIQKPLWYFFVKRIENAQTGNLLLVKHQLLLVTNVCKMILSMIKTMLISILNESHAFKQSNLILFVPIFINGAVV